MTRFSAGQLVKRANDYELGEDLFTEIMQRKKINDDKQAAIKQKQHNTHLNNVATFKSLRAKKPDESTWGVGDLNVAIKAVKKREDGAIPLTKEAKQILWKKIWHRSPFMPDTTSTQFLEGNIESEKNPSEGEVVQPSLQDDKEFIEPVSI